MATFNDDFLCRRMDFSNQESIDMNKAIEFIMKLKNKSGKNGNIVVVNIGSARLMGDSFAPRLGTHLRMLELDEFSVYGTLENPIHALNLRERMHEIKDEIYDDDFVIAVDAAISDGLNVRNITFKDKPIHPRKGFDSESNLPLVGDMSLIYSVGRLEMHELKSYSKSDLVEDVKKIGEFFEYFNNSLRKGVELDLMENERICR